MKGTYHLNSALFLYLLHQHCQSQDIIFIRLLYSVAAPVRCSWKGIDSKGNKNILMHDFDITTFDCQGGSKVRGHLHALVLRCHCPLSTPPGPPTRNKNAISSKNSYPDSVAHPPPQSKQHPPQQQLCSL